MGHRIRKTYHKTREEAEQAQKDAKGTPGYSEEYPRGIFPCKVKLHPNGEVVDGWRSEVEEYYG